MKKNNKKGFTLAELLIVVAIIAILVAIAVPVFSGQLDKAKVATATANIRSAYAEYVADCLSQSTPVDPTVNGFKAFDAYKNAEIEGCTVTVAADKVTVALGDISNEIPVDLKAST